MTYGATHNPTPPRWRSVADGPVADCTPVTGLTDPLEVLPRLDGVFRFIPRHSRIDFERAGWWMTNALEGTHHGEHAFLAHFPCRCKMVVPI